MKKKKSIVLSSSLLVILATSFAPILITAWFHLIHGNHIECAGRSIRVPMRWRAKVEGGKAYISKFSSTVFSNGPGTGLISLWPVDTPPKSEAEKNLAYQSFTSVYWTYLAGGAGATVGPVKRGTGEMESVCMETSVVKDKWVSVACLAFRGTWYGTFYGDPGELDSFYRIIGNP